MEYNRVICCSALTLLKGVGDGKIGAIITEPPETVENLRQTVRQMARVVRPGGGLVLIGDHKSLRQWDRVVSRAGFDWVAEVIVLWNSGRRRGTQLYSIHSRVSWYTRRGLRVAATFDGLAIASNVLVCKRVPLEDKVHPSELPVGLTNFLVSLLSLPEDLIVDPYCGSGSVLVSAAQCERPYLGSDTEQWHVETASRRAVMADEEWPAPIYLWVNGHQVEL